MKRVGRMMAAMVMLAGGWALAEMPMVVPMPREVREGQGEFKGRRGETVLTTEVAGGGGMAETLLRERLGATARGGTGDSILLTTEGADAELGPEGYTLEVTPGRITIRANGASGFFYGAQTLLQLMPAAVYGSGPQPETWSVPAVTIRDRPRFGWRGSLLDVSRHFMSKSEVLQYLDAMAMHKLNVFHWHLTDDGGWRIEIKKYPRLTEIGAWREGIGFGLDPKASTQYDDKGRYGGFYTQEEIREVVAYAAARGITVVPEIEMPGHASAALVAYPELSCRGGGVTMQMGGGIFDDVYCAGNEKTFELLEGVLEEVIPLFPGAYVHVGGDECPKTRWKACAKCQERIKAEGLKDEHELQSYFIRRMEKFLNARGKKLIGWDEILEGGLAPNATVMSWRGTEGGIAAAKSGHDVVMCPTSHCYLDYHQAPAGEPANIGPLLTLEKVYGFEPIPEGLTAEEAKHILGTQGNVWAEYIPNMRHAQYMAYPRLAALAEVAWTPREKKDWGSFKTRAARDMERLAAMGVNHRPLTPEGVATSIGVEGEGRVRISAVEGLPIRYTTDGTDPGPSGGMRYEGPFAVDPERFTVIKVRHGGNGDGGAGEFRGHYAEAMLFRGVRCEIRSSMGTHEGNVPLRAIDGREDTFYWSNRNVRENDAVTLRFDQPVKVSEVRVVTGRVDTGGPDDGKDRLEAAVLEWSEDGKAFVAAGEFAEGSVEAKLDGRAVRAIRIRATSAGKGWLVVREIRVR